MPRMRILRLGTIEKDKTLRMRISLTGNAQKTIHEEIFSLTADPNRANKTVSYVPFTSGETFDKLFSTA